jgi:hypothetical protein
MASFKIYNCDFGVKVNGVSYDFEHVSSLQIESTVRNRITRGANAKNKIGITYKDGLNEPDRWTIPILQMSSALKDVLDSAFELGTRLECYCIDRTDGSSKMAKNAVLSNQPQQLTIDASAESLEVSLEFETFDSSEVHKS